VSISHIIAVWDMWQQDLDVALVFEDDAELSASFSDDLAATLQEAPFDWDMIIVGFCFNFHANDESQRVSQHLFRPPFRDRSTRCAHAIFWSYSGAKKLLSSLPNAGQLIFILTLSQKNGRRFG
jgi:GR25 family glycosyltransferase involved in LPS biosynthesis